MCYEPLRFSPIFRRFVNSRESRVGLPLTPLNLTTKSVCALAQSSLFCGVCLIALRSLAHSHKQHPPLCVFYTHSLPKHPSHLEHNLEAGSPLAGLHINTNSRTASGCRSHAYSPLSDISRSSSTLEGVLSSAFCLRLLSSSLVSCHSLVTRFCLGVTRFCLGVTRFCLVGDKTLTLTLVGDYASSVVGRNNERARASLPRSSLLPPSRRVCVLSSLSSLKRETGRALPRFVWLSVIQLRGPD